MPTCRASFRSACLEQIAVAATNGIHIATAGTVLAEQAKAQGCSFMQSSPYTAACGGMALALCKCMIMSAGSAHTPVREPVMALIDWDWNYYYLKCMGRSCKALVKPADGFIYIMCT